MALPRLRRHERFGLIGAEDAANLCDIPNARQRCKRLGNWLTKERAKELLQIPDRSTLNESGTTRSWLS
jgi:hypothetical protein